MSLENEINRLKRAKTDIRASLKTKIGLDIGEDIKLDKYGECINNVESTCTHVHGDFYSLRTNNGTDYSYLFASYSGTNLDLSNLDTSQVTDMDRMFYECGKLTALDVSNWDTSKVTNMDRMFYYCNKLTALDVSNWNTPQVTYMYRMFYFCRELTILDMSNWDTSQVTNMNSMFYYCDKLTTLDLSNWDTSQVTDMKYMLYNVPSTCTIYINPETFINSKTGQTFTPADLSWKGTEFTPKYN